ncbi:MAG: hypothetical protein PHQ36_14475 [Anaerolineales bacterium]|nr:hypothetical protein [Anaerolineales bacterium]
MKKNILLLTLLLAACMPAVEQPAAVLPQILPTPTAYIDAASYPTAQVALDAPNQSASGIEVRMENVAMDGKNLNANVCFTLPDTSDWGILSASLTYAGTVAQEFGTTLSSIQEPVNGGAGLRCDTLTFIVPPDADLTNAIITINAIGAMPRTDDYCSIYLPKIQQSLLERGIGITLDCADVNGVQTMRITGFPPEMTQQQAEEIVYSPDFYTVKGPWNFPFSLTQ